MQNEKCSYFGVFILCDVRINRPYTVCIYIYIYMLCSTGICLACITLINIAVVVIRIVYNRTIYKVIAS